MYGSTYGAFSIGADASSSTPIATGVSTAWLRASIVYPTGISTAWLRGLVELRTGISYGFLRGAINSYGASAAWLRAVSAPKTSISTAWLRGTIARYGVSVAYLRGASYLTGALSGSIRWRPVVTQAGVDVSARITGEIVVEANEGAARIAEYGIRPPAGPIAPASLVGAGVTIDFAAMDPSGNPVSAKRLFVGVMDRPELDINTGAIGATATDDLQGAASQLSREQVDALTPGAKWSSAVFSEGDVWQYLRDRMQTLPASVDRSPYGTLRLTPWQSKATEDIELTENDIIDGSLRILLPERNTMRNRVSISYSYRRLRYKLRVINCGWSAVTDLYYYMHTGVAVPTRDQVQQALSSSEWQLVGEINWTPVPAGPVTVSLPGGREGIWIVTDSNLSAVTTVSDKTKLNLSSQWVIGDQEVADKLTFGFVCRMQKRYVQSVQEDYTITVEHPESIAAIGVIAGTDSGSLEVDSSGAAAWEAWREPTYPAGSEWPNGVSKVSPPPVLTIGPTTKEIVAEYAPDAATNRSASNFAIETHVAKAQTQIYAGHRGTTVALSIPLNPDIDLDKTIRIATAELSTKGKVRKVTHRMDLGSGRAVSDIEIAVASLAGVGITYSTDSPVAPTAPDAPAIDDETAEFSASASNYFGRNAFSASSFDPDTMIGFSSNWVSAYKVDDDHPTSDFRSEPIYPEQFSFRIPGIDAASRDNAVIPVSATYLAGFQEDELTLTVS